MVVTVLLTGAMLIVHLLTRWRERASIPALHPAGWWLLPFLAYALVNVIWVTPVRWRGWLDWVVWAQMVAFFWVVLNGVRSSRPRRVLFFTLVLLGVIGVVFACYQRFVQPDWLVLGHARPGALGGRATGPFGIANSFAGFLLLILPGVAALAFRRRASTTARVWWGWVALVLLLGLGLTISRGGWMSLALAVTLWPLFVARGSWWRRGRIALIVLAAVGAACATVYWKSPKVRERFASLVLNSGEVTRPFMWRGAWDLFRDAPLVGTGAGSYNVLFERHRREGFRDEPLWAHNEYLNTLSDYGALGFLLFFGAAAVIAWRSVTQRRDEKAWRRDEFDSPTVLSGFAIGVLAFALQMTLDFHLKIPALGLALACIAALAVERTWRLENISVRREATSRWPNLVAVAVVGAFVILLVPRLRAEGLRQHARRAIDELGASGANPAAYAARVPGIIADLTRATELDPRNGQAWSDRAYAGELWAWVEVPNTAALGREAEKAADRALSAGPLCHEFWMRRGVALDMQARWGEASKDFARAVALAPNDAQAWYYYGDHLGRLKWAREPALAAVEFCLRLDPGNSAALALRQRLAINPAAH